MSPPQRPPQVACVGDVVQVPGESYQALPEDPEGGLGRIYTVGRLRCTVLREGDMMPGILSSRALVAPQGRGSTLGVGRHEPHRSSFHEVSSQGGGKQPHTGNVTV